MDIHGKALTVSGPINPEELGAVMMHEHLHSDIYNWDSKSLIREEKPISPERREYLLREAVPNLKKCTEYGPYAYVDVTMPPWRAWPTFYREVAELSGVNIILCTGFYREVEQGTYWVTNPDDAIWPFARQSSVEKLAGFCTKEILEGIHGTDVHAGAIKLGTSAPQMTETEEKTFRAGARAQKATGVHITTHCTKIGAETSQLKIFDDEGVDLTRVVIGHTASHLMNPDCRKVCIEWMGKGANFLPTNLGIGEDKGKKWQPLVDAIHEVFNAGHGDKLCLGLDSGYCSESGPFSPMSFLPPEPFLHMFTHTLPAFREMGLTEKEERAIMIENPQRIIPINR
jgi:phosphotriesterase-related protein